MKILLAEDNIVSSGLLTKILEKGGHEVIAAKDGKEAWELFRENNTQVVITDWIMPEMDGLTLCSKIRSGNFPNYTYLILLTAKEEKEDIIHGFESGADDFIQKPIKADELNVRLKAGERVIQLEEKLKLSQSQLLQSEKMASIGQLAAGVAHEINNPTGFVSSNLTTLNDYQVDILRLMKEYRRLMTELAGTVFDENPTSSLSKQFKLIRGLEDEIDVDFIIEDVIDLISDCKEGTERIKKIVLDLKDFAHPGEDKLQDTDINKGIESTLNVVWNELKYNSTVNKEYGDLPFVRCYSQQLNQVFMNIFVNAAQAIEKHGEINVTTKADDKNIEIKINDTGTGIPPENLPKIFDPFFTTKEVGKGTGLGMNVAYNIIKKHNGDIDVESTVGKGTTFTIRIPVSLVDDE